MGMLKGRDGDAERTHCAVSRGAERLDGAVAPERQRAAWPHAGAEQAC